MTYEKIFAEVKKHFSKASTKNFSDSFAFQFNITGEGEGIFYAAFKNGVLSVEPYDYKDRDAVFTADGETFIAIASGKLEPIDALNGGKLFIDGDYELSKQLLNLVSVRKTAAKKAAKKPAAKPAAKAAKKEAAKPAVKAAAPAAKAETKPAVKAEAKPAAKTEAKPAAKVAKK